MRQQKEITKVWTFQSSSNPDKTYETLMYNDGSTSCNCPGWTRRVDPQGRRSCTHIRSVDQGMADSMCMASKDYSQPAAPKKKPSLEKKKPAVKQSGPVVRKIQW